MATFVDFFPSYITLVQLLYSKPTRHIRGVTSHRCQIKPIDIHVMLVSMREYVPKMRAHQHAIRPTMNDNNVMELSSSVSSVSPAKIVTPITDHDH
jgi:hypothetical protein